jgi:hypothetical protein
MPSEIDLPARWRALAVEAIGLARELIDPAAKDAMLMIAQKYLALAELAVDARCQHRLELAPLSSGLEAPVHARPPDPEPLGDLCGTRALGPKPAHDCLEGLLATAVGAPLRDPMPVDMSPAAA